MTTSCPSEGETRQTKKKIQKVGGRARKEIPTVARETRKCFDGSPNTPEAGEKKSIDEKGPKSRKRKKKQEKKGP